MNKKYIAAIAILLIILTIFLVTQKKMQSSKPDGKLSVSASFYPLYFFAKEIGGDRAIVTNITPPSAEPHDYEPTAADIQTIEQSQLVILEGPGLESWGQKIKQNVDPKKTLVVNVGQPLMVESISEEGVSAPDPHVWLSPVLAVKMVDKIAQYFAVADNAHEEMYTANATKLKTKLNALDATYREGLKTCKTNDIVTTHEAFNYLAKEYHLNQVAISGLSPDTEPSAKQLAAIARFASENNVSYIFFETLVSPKLAEAIAREIDAKTLVLNPIEGLTAEELAAHHDYFTEMQSNLTNLRLALSCTP